MSKTDPPNTVVAVNHYGIALASTDELTPDLGEMMTVGLSACGTAGIYDPKLIKMDVIKDASGQVTEATKDDKKAFSAKKRKLGIAMNHALADSQETTEDAIAVGQGNAECFLIEHTNFRTGSFRKMSNTKYVQEYIDPSASKRSEMNRNPGLRRQAAEDFATANKLSPEALAQLMNDLCL